MTAVETEVKFQVEDLATLEQQLVAAGFTKITPRTFERNTLFDTAERTLRSQQSILRVRRYGERWIVTHKGLPPGSNADTRHKHRIETETVVEDGEAVASIFASLGYRPAFVYEKWRTEFADETGHCVLDETPIGLYAELEGPSDWIDATAAKLGIPHDQLLTASYGRLFEDWRQQHGSTAQNLTFAELGDIAS
jgi:adenylate cyclase, class 2